ncbi:MULTISPECIES: DUF6163 family protein [Methylobacterium]|uniref:DoxX family protein n=1 Tax=Methylobacterium hispanicum TaxID=270350 RepID=A0AAV4ZIJ3_9HYPH|nr:MULTISPECIES: DUF6163 family protein [Methylobacterium]GJD87931.1 hypothetical protein BHAOGJBA_1438 [Methylobacterium hispanicum]
MQARGREPDLGGDRIERSATARKSTWDTALIWFMRVTALIWLAKGVWSWIQILDAWPGGRPFEAEPFGRQAAIVYFAVIDATAAIGLWLTSAWGGVIWLLAVTSSVTLALLTPLLLPMPVALIGAQISIVLIYFLLSWSAAREVR